ncbi:MAG: prepilin peptidase, partial [Bacillota bacterium]|nr:prepilin peptidase [Bacillota bacterium]
VYSAGFICLVLRIGLIELRDGLFETDWQGSLVYGQLAFAGLIICWLLLVISLADLKYLIIPDQFIIMLALSGIGFMPIYSKFVGLQSGGIDQMGSLLGGDKAGFWQGLVGMLIGMAVMLLVALLGRLLLKTEAVGFGDVKLSGAIGLVVGINGIIPILVGAFLFSGVYAGLGLITRRLKGSDVIAFGPFLCGATMVYILVLLPLM